MTWTVLVILIVSNASVVVSHGQTGLLGRASWQTRLVGTAWQAVQSWRAGRVAGRVGWQPTGGHGHCPDGVTVAAVAGLMVGGQSIFMRM